MNAIVAAIGAAVFVGFVILRFKLFKAAGEYGRQHALPPGPARLTLGLGLSAVFVAAGILALVLPEQPWSSDGTRRGIPLRFYGVVMIPGGIAFAISVIRNRHKVVDRDAA